MNPRMNAILTAKGYDVKTNCSIGTPETNQGDVVLLADLV